MGEDDTYFWFYELRYNFIYISWNTKVSYLSIATAAAFES